MIRCETIRDFDLKDFAKLKEIERKNPNKNKEGKLYEGDTFKCDSEMAKYLTGNNKDKITVVKIIEVEPEKEAESTIEYTDKEIKSKATIKTKKSKKGAK